MKINFARHQHDTERTKKRRGSLPQTAVRFALLGARFLDSPGGEGTPYNGLYGEAERVPFSGRSYMKGSRISPAEACERIGKSVFSVRKKGQKS